VDEGPGSRGPGRRSPRPGSRSEVPTRGTIMEKRGCPFNVGPVVGWRKERECDRPRTVWLRGGRSICGAEFLCRGCANDTKAVHFPERRTLRELTRMVAHPHLIQIKTRDSRATSRSFCRTMRTPAATCFGDSGCPNFVDDTNVLAGVTRRTRVKVPEGPPGGGPSVFEST
jgi:hypothetical protein